jgi:dihydrodipicolinate synthase/N-acetylneuraminate lyase
MACAPMLSHFTGEHAMTPYMLFGARGVYSWFVNFNPHYILDWYEEIVDGQWEQAKHRQKRLHAFIRAKAVLEGSGNLHAIVNKAMAAASPFLVEANRTRRPYLPVSLESVAHFRMIVEEQFPDMLWTKD